MQIPLPWARVTHNHRTVLAELRAGGGTPTELRTRAYIAGSKLKQPAMSKLLKRLRERGFIAETIDTNDRRLRRYTLTPKGVILADHILDGEEAGE